MIFASHVFPVLSAEEAHRLYLPVLYSFTLGESLRDIMIGNDRAAVIESAKGVHTVVLVDGRVERLPFEPTIELNAVEDNRVLLSHLYRGENDRFQEELFWYNYETGERGPLFDARLYSAFDYFQNDAAFYRELGEFEGDSYLSLLDLPSGALTRIGRYDRRPIIGMDVSPDRRLVLSGRMNNLPVYYDTALEEFFDPEFESGLVSTFFSNQLIWSGVIDSKASFFSINGDQIAEVVLELPYSEGYTLVPFSPGIEYAVLEGETIGRSDQRIYILDATPLRDWLLAEGLLFRPTT
ncbi:MAG: hypothetical protein MI724_13235, partial [Spirochaetales bacterium]|nr:hypothetical protein [Spirochaetales bacterium]